jgi:hypothetical protein
MTVLFNCRRNPFPDAGQYRPRDLSARGCGLLAQRRKGSADHDAKNGNAPNVGGAEDTNDLRGGELFEDVATHGAALSRADVGRSRRPDQRPQRHCKLTSNIAVRVASSRQLCCNASGRGGLRQRRAHQQIRSLRTCGASPRWVERCLTGPERSPRIAWCWGAVSRRLPRGSPPVADSKMIDPDGTAAHVRCRHVIA